MLENLKENTRKLYTTRLVRRSTWKNKQTSVAFEDIEMYTESEMEQRSGKNQNTPDILSCPLCSIIIDEQLYYRETIPKFHRRHSSCLSRNWVLSDIPVNSIFRKEKKTVDEYNLTDEVNILKSGNLTTTINEVGNYSNYAILSPKISSSAKVFVQSCLQKPILFHTTGIPGEIKVQENKRIVLQFSNNLLHDILIDKDLLKSGTNLAEIKVVSELNYSYDTLGSTSAIIPFISKSKRETIQINGRFLNRFDVYKLLYLANIISALFKYVSLLLEKYKEYKNIALLSHSSCESISDMDAKENGCDIAEGGFSDDDFALISDYSYQSTSKIEPEFTENSSHMAEAFSSPTQSDISVSQVEIKRGNSGFENYTCNDFVFCSSCKAINDLISSHVVKSNGSFIEQLKFSDELSSSSYSGVSTESSNDTELTPSIDGDLDFLLSDILEDEALLSDCFSCSLSFDVSKSNPEATTGTHAQEFIFSDKKDNAFSNWNSSPNNFTDDSLFKFVQLDVDEHKETFTQYQLWNSPYIGRSIFKQTRENPISFGANMSLFSEYDSCCTGENPRASFFNIWSYPSVMEELKIHDKELGNLVNATNGTEISDCVKNDFVVADRDNDDLPKRLTDMLLDVTSTDTSCCSTPSSVSEHADVANNNSEHNNIDDLTFEKSSPFSSFSSSTCNSPIYESSDMSDSSNRDLYFDDKAELFNKEVADFVSDTIIAKQIKCADNSDSDSANSDDILFYRQKGILINNCKNKKALRKLKHTFVRNNYGILTPASETKVKIKTSIVNYDEDKAIRKYMENVVNAICENYETTGQLTFSFSELGICSFKSKCENVDIENLKIDVEPNCSDNTVESEYEPCLSYFENMVDLICETYEKDDLNVSTIESKMNPKIEIHDDSLKEYSNGAGRECKQGNALGENFSYFSTEPVGSTNLYDGASIGSLYSLFGDGSSEHENISPFRNIAAESRNISDSRSHNSYNSIELSNSFFSGCTDNLPNILEDTPSKNHHFFTDNSNYYSLFSDRYRENSDQLKNLLAKNGGKGNKNGDMNRDKKGVPLSLANLPADRYLFKPIDPDIASEPIVCDNDSGDFFYDPSKWYVFNHHLDNPESNDVFKPKFRVIECNNRSSQTDISIPVTNDRVVEQPREDSSFQQFFSLFGSSSYSSENILNLQDTSAVSNSVIST